MTYKLSDPEIAQALRDGHYIRRKAYPTDSPISYNENWDESIVYGTDEENFIKRAKYMFYSKEEMKGIIIPWQDRIERPELGPDDLEANDWEILRNDC